MEQSEDQLRSIIFDPKTPDFWTMSLQPTDTAPFQLQAVDVPAAVSRALGERTDLIAARKRLEITDYNLKYFKNQTLPNLNMRFDYNSTGLGGTQLIRDPDSPVFPPPVIGEAQRTYGDLLGDVFSNAFPTYVVSLNVSYPIGRSIADASLARTKIEKSQSDLSLRQLELQVTQQVRDAARQLIANSKRVNATTRCARARGTPPRSRGEEVRGRHVHELRGLPGAARPGAGPQQRATRRARLQQVAG